VLSSPRRKGTATSRAISYSGDTPGPGRFFPPRIFGLLTGLPLLPPSFLSTPPAPFG
jgi:hypothetical protein